MGSVAPSALFSSLLTSLRSASPTIILTTLLALILTGIFAAYLLVLIVAHYPRPETPSERTYRTVTANRSISRPQPLPHTLIDDADIEVSVVVPAYNEKERLPGMLAEAVSFLADAFPEKPSKGSKLNGSASKPLGSGWEIIIVDDGSKDGTADVALEWVKSRIQLGEIGEDQIRVVVLQHNRGKGGAVTHGMRHARGRYAIFADADGASKFADLGPLLEKLKRVEKEGYGIAVGSRAHMVTTDAVVKRTWVRNLLMYSFHTLIRTVGIRHIDDTQCGFKLFSRAAIRDIFPFMHTEGWIFDIEILLLAWYKSIPVVEVPITWHEVEGTKMDLVKDSIRMAYDLMVVRAGYAFGVYVVGSGGPRG